MEEQGRESAPGAAADGAVADNVVADNAVADGAQSAARRRWLFAAVSAAVIVVLVVCMSLLLWQRHGSDGGGSSNAQVEHGAPGNLSSPFIDEAEDIVLNIINATPETVEQNSQEVLASSTGAFHDTYKQSEDQYVGLVKKAEAHSEGTIVQSALESTDGTSGTVLVVASTQVRNKSVSEPSERDFRMRVTVVEDGGEYKVSDLQQVV